MPKNWKYIKKMLEKDFLCKKLRGHITYDLTNYRPAPWYQQHFIMKYDDEILLEATQVERAWYREYESPEITRDQTDIIAERLYKSRDLDKYGLSEYGIKQLIDKAIDDADKWKTHHKGIFGVSDIVELLSIYLHSDIEESLRHGQDSFINALAILDRRCGKRRLQKYACWKYSNSPEWLRRIYRIRFEAEGIEYDNHYITSN